MAVRSSLALPRPPWVEVVVLGAGPGVDDLGRDLPGFVVRRLEGRRCAAKADVLRELARAFAFPAHFGENWDALEDCLGDLEWLPGPGYLLVVRDADRLLAGREADYRTLLEILQSVGAEWSRAQPEPLARPARPFHTLLAVTPEGLPRRASWLAPVRAVAAPRRRGRRDKP